MSWRFSSDIAQHHDPTSYLDVGLNPGKCFAGVRRFRHHIPAKITCLLPSLRTSTAINACVKQPNLMRTDPWKARKLPNNSSSSNAYISQSLLPKKNHQRKTVRILYNDTWMGTLVEVLCFIRISQIHFQPQNTNRFGENWNLFTWIRFAHWRKVRCKRRSIPTWTPSEWNILECKLEHI